jgi:adenosine deaminase CECR1
LVIEGRPLIDYAERLLEYPENIRFFFHAGETNWMGTTSDENLVKFFPFLIRFTLRSSYRVHLLHQIDAVLLGTKRIGHGFAIVKYPNILKIVKQKRIGIEVNPISNQVLKLVDDLRNHPSAILFSDDNPVVISRYDFSIICLART